MSERPAENTLSQIRTDAGMPIYLAPKPCSACGCFEAFAFECNCGLVHSDVCFNCGGFVDMEHDPIEKQNEGLGGHAWAVRCDAGRVEHTHQHPATGGRDRD